MRRHPSLCPLEEERGNLWVEVPVRPRASKRKDLRTSTLRKLSLPRKYVPLCHVSRLAAVCHSFPAYPHPKGRSCFQRLFRSTIGSSLTGRNSHNGCRSTRKHTTKCSSRPSLDQTPLLRPMRRRQKPNPPSHLNRQRREYAFRPRLDHIEGETQQRRCQASGISTQIRYSTWVRRALCPLRGMSAL